METVLSLDNLRTEFRMRTGSVVAVDGVSFDVGEGECVGIVGESGCGKSTTGLSIMRLLPNNGHLTGGSVTLLGRDLAGLTEKEMRSVRGDEVALIPQDPMTSLNPTMTIGRQIAEGVKLHRDVTRQQARARALEVLRLVEMPQPAERLDQYPHELSGGLRQRVMIAMALACEPKLLIADEPTTALDVTIQAQILDLIDDLRKRLSMAVVLITHDMGVIAGRTDRVVVMYAGKVAEEAETEELFTRIRHPYSEALLASVPKIDQSQNERLLSIPGLPPDLSQTITNCRFAPRCQYATDQCRTEDPPLVDVTGDGTNPGVVHRFACFHPVDHGVREKPAAAIISPESLAARADRSASLSTAGTILEVCDLVKEFPVHVGQRVPAPGGERQGGVHRVLRHPEGGDLRPGRRVRMREDHRGTTAGGPGPCHVRDHPVRGGRDELARRRPAPEPPARPAADVPGSLRVPRPPDAGRNHHPRAVEGAQCGQCGSTGEAGPLPTERGRVEQ